MSWYNMDQNKFSSLYSTAVVTFFRYQCRHSKQSIAKVYSPEKYSWATLTSLYLPTYACTGVVLSTFFVSNPVYILAKLIRSYILVFLISRLRNKWDANCTYSQIMQISLYQVGKFVQQSTPLRSIHCSPRTSKFKSWSSCLHSLVNISLEQEKHWFI